jgi:hypothetical protein
MGEAVAIVGVSFNGKVSIVRFNEKDTEIKNSETSYHIDNIIFTTSFFDTIQILYKQQLDEFEDLL